MEHEATEQLIRTLNGQLKELPSLAKTMVQQYQMSAIVLSILFGVLFTGALVGTIWAAVFFYKKNERSADWTDDYGLVSFLTATIGGFVSLAMLAALCLNLVHACTPISSLVSSFLG